MSASLVDTAPPWCHGGTHLAWRATVRDFAERRVRPGAVQRDRNQIYDEELAHDLGDLGLFGLMVPEEFGGSGGDLTSLCIAVEELARVDASVAVTVHVQAINATLIARLGRPDQKAELLPRLATGETFLAFGLTEPDGGTDTAGITSRAVRGGDGWVLNGSKQFITNSGTRASRYVAVVAQTGNGRSSVFLVPTDLPGVTVGPAYGKLGWRASDTHPIHLEDVRINTDALLGEEGEGLRTALHHLTWARIPMAAMSAGLAQGCLEATHAFVTRRRSFGKPLAAHQSVAFDVADIAAQVHAARVLTYDACWRFDNQQPYEQQAAIAKLVASELANKTAYQSTQLHGGAGFMDDIDVTRFYRDARILTIGEGTSQVQRMLIARSMGLPA